MNISEFLFRWLPNFTYFRRANYVRQQWVAYDWIMKHISWKDDDFEYEDVFCGDVDINNSIFLYWKQGWDKAPEIVKKCLESVEKYSCNHPVILLDENNRYDYVRFPDHIMDKYNKGIVKEALFSDLLRISLLIKYGGYWCDATCLLTAPIPDFVDRSDFFMFNRTLLPEYMSPIEGSNWFIRCKNNGEGKKFLSDIRGFLYSYYFRKDFVLNYYIFHLTMSALINSDEKAKSLWQNKPYICNMVPHSLQYHLSSKYNYDMFDQLVKQCFIHKLTYKYDKRLVEAKDKNVLMHLLGI